VMPTTGPLNLFLTSAASRCSANRVSATTTYPPVQPVGGAREETAPAHPALYRKGGVERNLHQRVEAHKGLSKL
jgi:hypothetical protein